LANGNSVEKFGNVAQGLAKNPLGIIALFIVMVYGFAAMVTGFSGGLSINERLPLIYFLVSFPILVLIAFCWLVSRHHAKLFAPSDYQDEDNYIKMQMSAVASLSAASAKNSDSVTNYDINELVELVRTAGHSQSSDEKWKNHVLWVDDIPSNNTYERAAFQAVGIRFTLAETTDEAFDKLADQTFAAVISDMGRREGAREGYVLLDRMRAEAIETPVFFYASSNAPEHKQETRDHGGQGCTNDPQELFQMVTRQLISSRQQS
jgi:CheY-like chemotaxis protein